MYVLTAQQKKLLQIESQEYEFWQRRSKDARTYVIMITISNIYYQLMAILKPSNPAHWVINIIYTTNSVLIFLLDHLVIP